MFSTLWPTNRSVPGKKQLPMPSISKCPCRQQQHLRNPKLLIFVHYWSKCLPNEQQWTLGWVIWKTVLRRIFFARRQATWRLSSSSLRWTHSRRNGRRSSSAGVRGNLSSKKQKQTSVHGTPCPLSNQWPPNSFPLTLWMWSQSVIISHFCKHSKWPCISTSPFPSFARTISKLRGPGESRHPQLQVNFLKGPFGISPSFSFSARAPLCAPHPPGFRPN